MSGLRNPITAWPLRMTLISSTARLLDAEDHVRLGVELDRRDDRRAGLLVGLVGDERARAGAGLDEDLQPGRLQLAERFGYQGDAPLAGCGLLGDADLHGHHLTLG